jgi:hypothetical protein
MGGPEFRKPIFGFLWTGNDNSIDNQNRFIRVTHRGIIRLTMLSILTLGLMSVSAISINFLLITRELISSLLLSALIASFAVLTFRAWMLGTFVNDTGVKIVNLFSTQGSLWSEVAFIASDHITWRLGPISLGIRTPRVIVVLQDSRRLHTHIYVGSVDGIFSQATFDTALSFINRWFRSE